MRAVSLIASNFLREHRWPVLILFAWIVVTALAAGGFGRDRVVPDDVVFYVQQQAVYICVFSAFLAADAIHNERKSRRILLVLSKAISRGQYLLAVILGTSAMAVAYALVFGLCGVWLTARAALPSGQLWSVVLLIMAGSVITATVAMFFLHLLESVHCDCADVTAFLRSGSRSRAATRLVSLAARPAHPGGCDAFQFSVRLGDELVCSGSRDCGSGDCMDAGGSGLQPERHRDSGRITAAGNRSGMRRGARLSCRWNFTAFRLSAVSHDMRQQCDLSLRHGYVISNVLRDTRIAAQQIQELHQFLEFVVGTV